MAPIKNGRVYFNEIPTGFPEPGKTVVYSDDETIDIETAPLNGGFLVKTIALSIDPYLRSKMREPDTPGYVSAFRIGETLYNYGVGVVVRSENASVKPGDHIYGVIPFQEYFIRPNLDGLRILKNEEGLEWTDYLGVAGMAGQTAWCAWQEYSNAQKGEVVFVTAGAGPVGSFVIQLAKAQGLKVIASAGSDAKVEFLKSLGTDVAFNYKTTNTFEVLKKEGPINIYWDNVGGESLDAALKYAAKQARFLECGMISHYNQKPPHINNLFQIVSQEITIYGFLIFTLLGKYEEQFYREVPKRIAAGDFKHQDDIKVGLHLTGEAIYEVQAGKNKGKSTILVSRDE
jgi:NADPH-dependent curcumin reductase CurA